MRTIPRTALAVYSAFISAGALIGWKLSGLIDGDRAGR